MLAGLALYALGQRAARAGEVPRWAFGHPASTSAAGVFVAGLLVAAVFLFLPARPNRAPQVAEVRAMATLAAGGLGVACLGVVAAAACFRYVGDRFLVAGLAVAAFVAIVGAAVSLASAARADGLRRAAAAPARGLDADTAGVLRSLDALLGELPESAVHRFVASPEGDAYLRLLDAMEDGDA
jgi:hypothetical protein